MFLLFLIGRLREVGEVLKWGDVSLCVHCGHIVRFIGDGMQEVTIEFLRQNTIP